MKERNPLYDRAKGIGMILVVYGHMFTYGNIPFSVIFSFHMPLFFIVSGMLLSPSKFEHFNYGQWTRSVLLKYIPPVVFFSVLGGIVRFALYGTPNWDQIVIDFIRHMSSDELLTGALWFISALALVMSLIPLLIRSEKLTTEKGKWIVFISLSLVAYLLSKVPHSLPFLIKTIPVALLFVYIGYVYKNELLAMTTNLSSRRIVVILLPVFVLLVILNKTVNLAIPEYNDFFVYMFCALFGTVMTLQISTYSMPRLVEAIGKNSLIFFSLHAIWIRIYTDLLNNILGTSYTFMVDIPFIYVLIGGILVILFTALSTWMIRPVYNATLRLFNLI